MIQESTKCHTEICEFIYGLFNDTVNSSHHTPPNKRMINGLERMWNEVSWPNLRYYPGIRQKGLRKITKEPQSG
jgi:hypothetical protein